MHYPPTTRNQSDETLIHFQVRCSSDPSPLVVHPSSDLKKNAHSTIATLATAISVYSMPITSLCAHHTTIYQSPTGRHTTRSLPMGSTIGRHGGSCTGLDIFSTSKSYGGGTNRCR